MNRKRAARTTYLAATAALTPLLLITRTQAANTVYTYTPDGLTTDTWSAGTGWSPTAPGSSNTSELAFATGFQFTSGFTDTTTDDITGPFNLNAMDLNGNLSSGTASLTINALPGNNLNFSGTSPVINLAATNGSGAVLTYNINGPINFGTSLAMNASGTGVFNFAGNISGGGGLSVTGVSPTANALAVNFSGTNSYTGVTTIAANQPASPLNLSGGNTITVTVSGNQTAANGGWLIDPGGNNYGISVVNFSSGSLIAVAAGKTFQLGHASASGNSQYLNVAGTVTNAGTLNILRTAVFNVSSGGVWNQSGGMNFNVPNGGNSSTANILAGGIFNYNGPTPIVINSANSSSGSATLTIGGLFNTSAGFVETVPVTGVGKATLALNGGTLLLSNTSNIATIATVPLAVTLATGTISTINTNGSLGTNIISSNISGAGMVVKAGSGSLTFSGTSFYTGATNISGGTLAIATSNSLPATTTLDFGNTTGPATLDITGLNQSIGGLAFGTQTTGTNTSTILGNSSTSLTLNASAATTIIAPANVSNASLTLDMSSLGGFTYNNPGGTLEIGPLINTGTTPSELVKLASNTDQITTGTLNVGYQGTGSTTSPSTLILGTNTTLDVNFLDVGSSGSRASGYLNAGSGTLTIAGQTGGASLASVLIGRSDNTGAASGATISILDTSAGTLNAQLSTVIIGETQPNNFTTASRGVTINANFNMGLGNLSATSLTIGMLQNNANDVGSFTYTELVNGSFNMTGGTATIPTITLGTSAYVGNFNTTSPSIVNAAVTLNSGSVLNATTIAEGTIATPAMGTLTVNPQINWNDGTINNIAGSGLTIGSTVAINIVSPGNHAFNISSGQTGSIAGVINGSGGVNIIGLGTVTLGASNLYSGATNISSGGLLAGGANTLSPNSVINILGGILDASAGANTIAGLNAGSVGTLNLSFGSVLAVTGTASFAGTLNLLGTATTLPETLINYNSDSGTFTTVIGVPGGDSLSYTATALILVNPLAGPANLNWTNASGDGMWNTSSLNFNTSAGTPAAYSDTSNTSLGAGDIVAFTDNNNGSYNVSIPAVVHPTSVTVNNSAGSYTFNGSGGIAGPGALIKMGSAGLALFTSNSYRGGTNISGGVVSLYNTHALPSFGNVSIGSTAKLVATTLGNSYLLQISGLNLASGGTIDLKNNAAAIRGSSLSTVYGLVKSGYAGGSWNGSGITSSVATGPLTALGVIINDTGANYGGTTGTGIYSNFSGGSTADGDVLVKYTYYGDANLDGHVDGSDYSLIDNGFLNHLTGWYNGDFNYDGVVNGSDYTLMDNAFNTQGASIASQVASPDAVTTAQIAGGTSAVPEPASLSLLCLAATGLLGRRRRQH